MIQCMISNFGIRKPKMPIIRNPLIQLRSRCYRNWSIIRKVTMQQLTHELVYVDPPSWQGATCACCMRSWYKLCKFSCPNVCHTPVLVMRQRWALSGGKWLWTVDHWPLTVEHFGGCPEDPGKYPKMPDPGRLKKKNFYPHEFWRFLSVFRPNPKPRPIFIRTVDQASKKNRDK